MRSRIVILALLLAAALVAQEKGRLTGSVQDASGAAVAGAKVSLYLPGGKDPLFQATTTSGGLFQMVGLVPDTYNLGVDAAGFAKLQMNNVIVAPGRETSLPALKLELATVATTLSVQEQVTSVNTSNAEVTSNLSKEVMHLLPQLDRSPLGLISTQAGVGSNGLENTVINGQRTSFTNITFAGINVQDNYIRDNALDFSPNLLLEDEVDEMTITTSNSNPALGAGASQIAFTAPKGGNVYHGSLLWQNRNNATAANNWFANQAGTPLAFLNQNQAGASVGGRIIRDKLFFYVNYEAFRNRQQMTNTQVDGAPATILTATARQGLYTYLDSRTGQRRQVNILQASGLPADPTMAKVISQIPGPQFINNYAVGDSTGPGDLRNTAGYQYLVRDNRDRNNVLGSFDYIPTVKHALTLTVAWNNDVVDRPDADSTFNVVPTVKNDDVTRLLSASWRWTPFASLTNELRGGFNLAPALFITTAAQPTYMIGGLLTSNPIQTFLPQGRFTNTYQIADNANYTRGKHGIQFGYSNQFVRVNSFDYASTVPTYNLGFSTANNHGLTNTQLPGASAVDLANANQLLAMLAGQLTSAQQVYNVTSETSGYVPGAPVHHHLSEDIYSFYGQDNWRVTKRLTLNLGVRYEYFTPVKEENGIALLPVIQNNNPIQTLLNPNTVLNFASGNTNRPFYKSDKNNFAPNIGMAWDIFGDGRTALRGGYSINFVNDEFFRSVENNAVDTNSGLVGVTDLEGLTGSFTNNLPALTAPAFKVPRTLADNYANDPTSAVAMPDPGLVAPYVQQWNVSIQRQIKSFVLDVRYVGNHGTKLFRAIDYNQVNINASGFLADFLRAENNGNLALASRGTFNPQYNPAIAGSQPLTVFPKLTSGGLLGNSTVRTLIQEGQIGALAELYQVNALNGAVNFFNNPNVLGADMLTNYSNSSYNALQVDLVRRFQNGLFFQANYVFSRNISDAFGNDQTRFEPFLDINNAKLEKSLAPFDQRHVFKLNYVYELPFGKGKMFNLGRFWNRVVGGFSTSGIITWSAGNPFSFYSTRATFNRPSRSINETADSTLTAGQINNLLGLRFTGDAVYYVANSAVNPSNGLGVAADGAQPFNGEVFTNPGAGTVGILSKQQFRGPTWFSFDAGIQKKTYVTERISLELRAEAQNILNHPTFFVGDQNINSNTFGQIVNTQTPSRVLQIAAYVRF